jgi:branched-chain amino acid transport system ATP-binding protein
VVGGYGPTVVLRDVSLEVAAGEMVCVLGANGVGKTTLLRSLFGLAKVRSGQILFHGREIQGRSPNVIAKHGIGYVPEGRGLIPDLSVRDNLVLGTVRWNRRYSCAAVNSLVDEMYARFPVLGTRAKQLAGLLSGGEQQMLAIARALVSRPKVLVLDEPTLGLAPLIVQQVFDDLAKIRDAGIAVLVAEQNAAAALRRADRAYVMTGGRIVTSGSVSEIRESSALRSAYLGDH